MINRPGYIAAIEPFIDKPLVKILAGIRRCGKSTIFEMLREELLRRGLGEDQIICKRYTEMDIPENITAKQMYDELTAAMAGKGHCYLLLDEIQEITGWEKAVNSLLERADADLAKAWNDYLKALTDQEEAKEEWDNAFAYRKIVAEEAVRDNSIWGVVIAPRMQFFRNIPETLFVIIEDESDKISDEDWNRAWSEWRKKQMDSDYDNHINLEIISKYDMEKYAHRNRRTKNIIKKGRWLKGSYKDL